MRASLAARRSARPTAAEISLLFLSVDFFFIGIDPLFLAYYPNYHKRSGP